MKTEGVVSLEKHTIHHHGHNSSQIIIQITNMQFDHPPLALFHIEFTKKCREITHVHVLLERDHRGLESERMDDLETRKCQMNVIVEGRLESKLG